MQAETGSIPNPYVGPRAFMVGERLYGRSREAGQLANLLTAERIVLLYSPSGAGKTSLIQAALIPSLKQRRFHVLPVVRVNVDTSAYLEDGQNCNRYVFSALLSLEEGLPAENHVPRSQLACMSISDYLDQRPVLPGEIGSPMLVFDQFEEILTLNHTDQDAKKEFFEQLGAALERPDVWALFAMREEFTAALEPYLLPIPNRFKVTFRLDLLNEEAASKAIRGPAEKVGVSYSAEAIEQLVNDLRRVRVQNPDGSLENQFGPYVEPVQLQVVCHRLWDAPRPDPMVISQNDIAALGHVDQSLVDQSLAEYYAQRVADENTATERRIRSWFDEQLITESGVRGTVLKEPGQSGGLDNAIIGRLVDAHLVRAEKRGGATWFELAHDRLVGPVRMSNEAWFKQHLNLLQKRASQWVEEGRPESLLLGGQELLEAEGWAAENQSALVSDEVEFLTASRSLKRRKRVIAALGLVVIVLAALALLNYASAVNNARAAQAANTQSAYNLETAQAANIQSAYSLETAQAANTQSATNLRAAEAAGTQAAKNLEGALQARSRAATQAAIAQAASTQAILESERAKLAEAAAKRSLSYQLAAQGKTRLNSQTDSAAMLDIAALLGVEALLAEDTPAARELLLLSLARSQQQQITIEDISAESQIRSLVAGPDGNHYAYGLENGSVVLGNFSERWRRTLPRMHNSAVTALTFSHQPSGRYLASGDIMGFVRLRDLDRDETRLFRFGPIESPLPIHDLDFHPNQNWLAVSSARNVYLYAVEKIWDITATTLPDEGRFFPNAGNVTSMAWSPDGKYLVVGDDQKYVQVWELGNTDAPFDAPFIKPVSPPHRGAVQAVAWSPDGERYASTAIDYENTQVIIWRFPAPPSGEPEWSFKLPGLNRHATSLSFSKDGNILAVGNIEGKVYFWDTRTGLEIGERLIEYSGPDEVNNNDIAELVFLPSAGPNRLAAAQVGGKISIFTLNIQQSLAQDLSQNLGGPVLALDGEPDGHLLAAVQTTQGIQVMRILENGMAQSLFSIDKPAYSVAFNPDGQSLALGDTESGAAILYSVETGQVLREIPLAGESGLGETVGVYSLAFGREGTDLAGMLCSGGAVVDGACGEEGALLIVARFYDQDTSYLTQEFSNSNLPPRLAFNAAGTTLAISSGETISLWGISRAAQSEGEPGKVVAPVTSLAYSPDGALLAAGDASSQVWLWNFPTASNVISQIRSYPPLSGASGQILSMAFNEQGDTLYLGLDNGIIQRWDLKPQTWAKLACTIADNRDFTWQEWEEFFPGQELRSTCANLALAATPTP